MMNVDTAQNRPRPDVRTPSRRGYLVAALTAVFGLVFGVGGLILGVNQLSSEVDGFDRVSMPGQGSVTFEAPGDYTLYYESLGGGQVQPFQALLASPSGERVPMTAYEGSFDYSVGKYDGTAVATFHIDKAGTYDLRSESLAPVGSGQLAVGKGLGGHLASTLIPGLILFVAFVTATVVASVTAVRRRRSGRLERIAAAAPAA